MATNLKSISDYIACQYSKVKTPKTISDYITSLYIKHFYISLLVFILALSIGVIFGWKNPLLLILYFPVAAAFYVAFLPPKRKIAERVWRAACPNCENYIPLAEWKCLCGKNYRGTHILEGCQQDGTRYGSGEDSEVRSVECKECKYELGLYEPYSFEKWSILEKGEESDEEFIPIKRETWMYAIGSTLSLGGGLVALYSMVKDISSLGSSLLGLDVMIPVVGIIVFGWILILLEPKLYPQKKYIRNPQYKGESR